MRAHVSDTEILEVIGGRHEYVFTDVDEVADEELHLPLFPSTAGAAQVRSEDAGDGATGQPTWLRLVWTHLSDDGNSGPSCRIAGTV
ncbi:hypothetical protein L612_005200000070 [Rhodococcus rhodochrous J38]|nr:hypothetical protein L612_005200000070 [Rhodococcus rhodochrous J38]